MRFSKIGPRQISTTKLFPVLRVTPLMILTIKTWVTKILFRGRPQLQSSPNNQTWNRNSDRLDKTLKAWENAAGTPEEAEKKAEAVKVTEYYKQDLESGSKREQQGNLYLLIGIGLLALNGIIFFMARVMRKKDPPEGEAAWNGSISFCSSASYAFRPSDS
jgi:hypothetical protein